MRMQMPTVEVSGDDSTRIMARSGELVGFSRTRAVWRFGFLSDSDSAKAFGVHVLNNEYLWVLASASGHVFKCWQGFAFDLPEQFWKVFHAKL